MRDKIDVLLWKIRSKACDLILSSIMIGLCGTIATVTTAILAGSAFLFASSLTANPETADMPLRIAGSFILGLIGTGIAGANPSAEPKFRYRNDSAFFTIFGGLVGGLGLHDLVSSNHKIAGLVIFGGFTICCLGVALVSNTVMWLWSPETKTWKHIDVITPPSPEVQTA